MTAPIPAWGSPDPARPVEYLVVGFYGYNGQRFAQPVVATSPRAAEDLVKADLSAQRAADGSPSDPQVCGVVAVVDGRALAMDGYATYLDPDMPEVTE